VAELQDDALPPLPDEPLAASAPLAREWSEQYCRHIDDWGMSCRWAHGLWQYLRLLNFAATPRDHAAFYHGALGPLIRDGRRRILVSGSADYAMPACVLWAYASMGEAADLTVADICETPLRLSAWYARRAGARLTTEACDVLSYRPAQPFEIICTHAFLPFFAPAERPALIAHWRTLLVAGGCLITVNRVQPDAPEAFGFSAEQARDFRARVMREAGRVSPPLAIAPGELAEMATQYATLRRHPPPRSAQELTRLFEAGGFRVAFLRVGPVGARPASAPSGPTMSSGAQYAQLVAVRD